MTKAYIQTRTFKVEAGFQMVSFQIPCNQMDYGLDVINNDTSEFHFKHSFIKGNYFMDSVPQIHFMISKKGGWGGTG